MKGYCITFLKSLVIALIPNKPPVFTSIQNGFSFQIFASNDPWAEIPNNSRIPYDFVIERKDGKVEISVTIQNHGKQLTIDLGSHAYFRLVSDEKRQVNISSLF